LQQAAYAFTLVRGPTTIEGMRPRAMHLAVLPLFALAAPAEAAATFPRIDASTFQLVAGSTFATYGERTAALADHAGRRRQVVGRTAPPLGSSGGR
jgi:hypothetical protein